MLRPVYESMTRADPTSQARVPAGASTIMALEDYHFLLRAISSEQRGARSATGVGRDAKRGQLGAVGLHGQSRPDARGPRDVPALV